MFYYRLTHFFITRQPEHFHWFDIGIYESKEKAQAALEQLKTQPGFCLRPKAFRIRRVFRFREPLNLNLTCWAEGFETYTYKPHAQSKVHKKGRDDSSPGRYFITFCTDEHEPLLWDEAAAAGFPPLSQIGCVVASTIPLIHDNFRRITVDRYCIMPDHIHMILSIHPGKDERYDTPTKLSEAVLFIMNAVATTFDRHIWQALFFGRKIRTEKELLAAQDYIENNPTNMDAADEIPDFKNM